MRKPIFLTLLLALFLACGYESSVASAQEQATIILQRPGCMKGDCPMYQVEIFDDGRVVYDGRLNVATLGKRTSQISEDVLRKLREAFNQAKFFAVDTSHDAVDNNKACATDVIYDCKEVIKKELNRELRQMPRYVVEQCREGRATVTGTIGVGHCGYGDKLYYNYGNQSKWIVVDALKNEQTKSLLQELQRTVDRQVEFSKCGAGCGPGTVPERKERDL